MNPADLPCMWGGDGPHGEIVAMRLDNKREAVPVCRACMCKPLSTGLYIPLRRPGTHQPGAQSIPDRVLAIFDTRPINSAEWDQQMETLGLSRKSIQNAWTRIERARRAA